MQNFSGWIAEEWTAREKLARRRAAGVGAAIGGLCAFVGVIAVWGFCVDDAWIIARVAAHWSEGGGHRFNLEGPVVDAVTPFGYAQLVGALSDGTAMDAFETARLAGASGFLLAAIALGFRVGSAGIRQERFLPLALLALSIGMPAWAVAGMETGLVVALVVFGAGPRVHHAAMLGLAAAWRPELLPCVVVLCLGTGFAAGGGIRGALVRVRVLAKGEHDDAKDNCSPSCSDDDLSSGRALALTSTILTGVAIVGAGVGAVLWFGTDDSPQQAMRTRPGRFGLRVAPNSAHALWQF